MKSAIVVQETLRAATVRHVGPYPEIVKAFARLEVAVHEAGLTDSPAAMVAIYHDNPGTTPAAELRSDAGLVLEPETPLPPSLTETVIAGGRYLHGRHLGSYAGLPAVWAYLREEGLREHGVRRGAGPAYELYPNHPGNVAVEELITDIYIPVV